MKAREGKVIRKEIYDRVHLKELRRLNLVGYCPKERKYFQRSWPEIHQVLEIQELTFVAIPHKLIFKEDIRDLVFCAGLQYQYRLQEKDGGNLKGKPSNRGKHMQPSVHNGGISHSLGAAFFGMSVHWSQNRRDSCMARGLIRFTRRKKPVRDMEPWEIPETDVPYRGLDITSACDFRVRFEFSVPKWLRHRLERRTFCKKQGCYVFG